VGSALPAFAKASAGEPAAPAQGAKGKERMRLRTLGRTKLKVSELGMGTIITGSAAVIQRACDLGITYFDTAECYRNGNSEIELGKALKGRRDKVVVATKWHTDGSTPKQDLIASVDASLKRLGMDHVELIQIHGADNEAQVNSDELWQAFTQLRKDGKVRFNGLSVHGNLAVIRAAIKSGRYDAVLTSHSAVSSHITPVLAEAKKAGVGVIIMKALQAAHIGKDSEAFQGLSGSPYQMCIQWLLKDPNVSTAIVDMPSMEQLEEDYQGAVTRLTKAELEDFERRVAVAAVGACRLCGACTRQCPAGVKVADIMRYALYHEGYGNREYATSLYRALPTGAAAAACSDCATCGVVCPFGVPVQEQLVRAHALMA
jgi:predicted aldo/keto reductase-like oxidoreductase